MIRINLWSGPRNISTALMYSFAQRADTRVHDEPLYAHYLTRTDARDYHPGAQEIIAAQENDGGKVVRYQMLGPCDKPVAFFKQMTHHLVELDWTFMREMVNVILTRDPRDMLPSYAQQVATPSLRDVGYAQHIELLQYLRDLGQEPVVLDARQTLLNPRGVLTTFCDRTGLVFDEHMLHWTAGTRPEDGVWAPHWYENVHRSTGFQPYRAKKAPLPSKLEPLLAECQPFYEHLLRLAVH
ncbi:MAG: sulfotransferase family protein [Gemmatimonadetes bacterium]|nr:sulfotransferase family protein [Gemmatimonadota bacterium]MBT6621007.1 sulfotransferase family protein [Gemmatimonadota bacterium]MBT7417375.1 sulfotransferase family protein [Gemmatimonadota bacterium]MBT7547668.1 sulfotransferase family protein [Gemmatimonadota bacterium]MBT7589257.1 sulfotransferase family protein [Gemmatimonadota bacterium]